MSYRASESFLRLLSKVFKASFPQECLTDESRIALKSSFIAQALEYVYFQMI